MRVIVKIFTFYFIQTSGYETLRCDTECIVLISQMCHYFQFIAKSNQANLQ